MNLTREEIFHLLDAYTSKEITPAEEQLLFHWLSDNSESDELREYIKGAWEQNRSSQETQRVDWQAMYQRIVEVNEKDTERYYAEDNDNATIKNKLRFLSSFSVAAAVIAVAIGLTVYFKDIRTAGKQIQIANSIAKDIAAPTSVKSILTLSNGQTIQLGNASSGILAVQDNIRIVKDASDGISYAGNSSTVTYNQLDVPNGSLPVKLVLSDGSKIWLNVGSSLRYPTAFVGKERKVELKGEAYFEIAHNASMPFIVQKGDMDVRVLGTHFDVSSYDDDAIAKITLLEGSVKVFKGSNEVTIKPGQQACVTDKIKVKDDVDLDEVMAWKAGKFKFGQDADIESIMRQISKWYNVNVRYEGKVDAHFWGVVSRSANVSEVLKILEATGGVKFSLEENTITVRPVANF